jgi:GNAT superfamily N-acetyltransferase
VIANITSVTGKDRLSWMPMTTTVRQAVSSDTWALARLVEQYWVFEGIKGYDHARVANLLRDALATPGRAACFIAEDAGDQTGYLLAVFSLSLEHGGMMAEVDEFFVVPAARGNGTGAILLQHAERSLQQLGMVRLQLQLASGNEHARAFYIAHGYAPRSGYELWEKGL